MSSWKKMTAPERVVPSRYSSMRPSTMSGSKTVSRKRTNWDLERCVTLLLIRVRVRSIITGVKMMIRGDIV